MKIKASGRSALIVATGFFVCFAAPLFATTSADGAKSENSATRHVKHGSRHWKSYAHHKSSKVAFRSFRARKAAAADADDDEKDLPPLALPPSVANANAQLASADPTPAADTIAGKARAMTARANDIVQASAASAQAGSGGKIVSADQLNDVDRALPKANLVLAAAETPPAAAPAAPAAPPPAAAASTEKSTWNETSLIGKIFIGFGALLTMASAARMFMA
jgi:hypothetical protein